MSALILKYVIRALKCRVDHCHTIHGWKVIPIYIYQVSIKKESTLTFPPISWSTRRYIQVSGGLYGFRNLTIWFYHDVGYLKDPILKICDFSANMYHMNMVFRFLESLLLGLSLECFLIIFGSSMYIDSYLWIFFST